MKHIDAEEITPIMAKYVADVFSRKEHLDDISYGYCMEIADVFRRYAERAEQEQPSEDLEKAARLYAIPYYMKDIDVNYIEEHPYDSGLEAAFIAGAEWQKEQLCAPVDGEVHHVLNCHYIATEKTQLSARLREIPEGAKVDIFIIAKEDEK